MNHVEFDTHSDNFFVSFSRLDANIPHPSLPSFFSPLLLTPSLLLSLDTLPFSFSQDHKPPIPPSFKTTHFSSSFSKDHPPSSLCPFLNTTTSLLPSSSQDHPAPSLLSSLKTTSILSCLLLRPPTSFFPSFSDDHLPPFPPPFSQAHSLLSLPSLQNIILFFSAVIHLQDSFSLFIRETLWMVLTAQKLAGSGCKS